MLRELALAATLIAAIMAISGCGNGVGSDGAVVGGDCVVSSDCAMTSRCLSGPDFPGGYCAATCIEPADCPGGSTCIDDPVLGGTCMVNCSTAAECRNMEGYGCEALAAVGTGTTANVCATPP